MTQAMSNSNPKLTFPGKLRPLGLYIAGNPGSGKSSLIQHLALRDIQAGRGVCVIDPTGDLVNRLVHHIPKSRVKDTIFFDTDNPVRSGSGCLNRFPRFISGLRGG